MALNKPQLEFIEATISTYFDYDSQHLRQFIPRFKDALRSAYAGEIAMEAEAPVFPTQPLRLARSAADVISSANSSPKPFFCCSWNETALPTSASALAAIFRQGFRPGIEKRGGWA